MLRQNGTVRLSLKVVAPVAGSGRPCIVQKVQEQRPPAAYAIDPIGNGCHARLLRVAHQRADAIEVKSGDRNVVTRRLFVSATREREALMKESKKPRHHRPSHRPWQP